MDDGGVGPPKRRSVLSSRVIGRAREIEGLRHALERSTERQGGAVFLLGEAGIGKSKLAQLTASDADGRGLAVLRGRAVQSPTPVAYRPLAEALCSAVRFGAAPNAPELLPFRTALGRLIPEWRVENQDRVEDSVVLLAEAVLRFLRAVAGDRGCLVVLEDLHWADPETLTIVEYLADNLTSERVLCLGTLRTEESSAGLDLVRALDARRTSEVLPLSRLDEHEVADMVRSCLNATVVPDEVLALASRADGVPFLVEELLAVGVTSGALMNEGDAWTLTPSVVPVVPLTFADSVRRRLMALGEEARSVLLAAAVLGRRFDWTLLPPVTGLPEHAVLGALHAAVDSHMVSTEGSTFRFRHALSREAALAELLPPERADLSRRALHAIETVHPALPEGLCELAAELAGAAGIRDRAAAFLCEAGRRALDRGALASAEATLERARAIAPSDAETVFDIEECLSEVLALAGKRDRAVEVGESLLAKLGHDRSAARRRTETYLRLARAAVAATRWNEARARVDEARASVVEADDERLTARVDSVDALTALGEDDPNRAVALARAALSGAERVNRPEVACEALEVLGRCERHHDLETAEAAFGRAYEIAEQHGLTVWRVRALHELGTIDLLNGRSLTRLEEAQRLALSQGALATAAVLDVQLAAALMVGDDPEPALPIARRGAELARRYGLRETLAAALGFEATVHARAHRGKEMEDCLREARVHAERDSDLAVLTACARALLAFGNENRADALRSIESVADIGFMYTGPLPGWRALLRALDVHDGEAAGGEALAHGEPTHWIARGYLRYAEAVVAGRARNEDEAVAKLIAGDRHLADLGWFRHFGRRLVAEAAIRDGWGEPVTWLREAQAFFERWRHEMNASACRSLLRRAGAPVPRRRAGTEDVPVALRALGVTSREQEVLRLLAEGLSNKEIAGRLYLSPRTVERHVANLATKAGLERRSQLVAFAARTASPDASAG